METRKNPYMEYPGRPRRILEEGFGIERTGTTVIVRDRGGSARYEVAERDFFDLLFPTMQGLSDDLVQGSPLGDRFRAEWEPYEEGEADAMGNYGALFYYPRRGHIVRTAPRFWHRLALVVRNSTLVLDPAMTMSWEEARAAFDAAVPAIAGGSLGNGAAFAVVSVMRPQHVKIADLDVFNLSNANRVRIGYEDLGRNKAVVTAEQLHAIDPFLGISVYEGVYPGNVEDFVNGNPEIGEPPATMVIEETDNPDTKVFIRMKARAGGVPVIMGSDIGSGAQRDVQRYDLDPRAALALGGVSDEDLLAAQEACKTNASLDRFFAFAFAILGDSYKGMPEFNAIVEDSLRGGMSSMFGGSAPQLGSTAMAAAALVAEAAARLVLGCALEERMFLDLRGASAGKERMS